MLPSLRPRTGAQILADVVNPAKCEATENTDAAGAGGAGGKRCEGNKQETKTV